MAIKIKFNDPRKDPHANLITGVTLVPVKSQYKDHYRAFAQNERYANRTDLGEVYRGSNGNMVCVVHNKEFNGVCGWTQQNTEVGLRTMDSVSEAVNSLYTHRVSMMEEGLINE